MTFSPPDEIRDLRDNSNVNLGAIQQVCGGNAANPSSGATFLTSGGTTGESGFKLTWFNAHMVYEVFVVQEGTPVNLWISYFDSSSDL